MFNKDQLVYKVIGVIAEEMEIEEVFGDYILIKNGNWYMAQNLASTKTEAWKKFQNEIEEKLVQHNIQFQEAEQQKLSLERSLSLAKFVLQKKEFFWKKDLKLQLKLGNKVQILFGKKGQSFEAVLTAKSPKEFLLSFADGTETTVSLAWIEDYLENHQP